MPRPASRPAPVPQEDDDDLVLGGGPTPPKAPDRHPVSPQGEQVPSRKGDSHGTKEPAQQSASEPSRQGEQVTSTQAVQAPEKKGGYEGRTKIGARIPDQLKARLKIASALTRRTEESIVEEAITQWLDRESSS
jgi:hypothetical protein